MQFFTVSDPVVFFRVDIFEVSDSEEIDFFITHNDKCFFLNFSKDKANATQL